VAVNAESKADKSQERFYDVLTSFSVDWPRRPLSDSAYIVLRLARE